MAADKERTQRSRGLADERYARIRESLDRSPLVISHEVQLTTLSLGTASIEGTVIYADGSTLRFFEFLRESAGEVTRDKYRYQYMKAAGGLVFRYDNAPHHRELPSFPHHKHLVGGVEGVRPPDFEDLISESEQHVVVVLGEADPG